MPATAPSPASTTKATTATTRPTPSLSIGVLAKSTGRTVHTIRWYEAQGLMPGVVRDAAGRRRYTPQHVNWLDLMARLRLTGMSIAKMRRYAALVRQGKATLAERRALLQAHREEVLARIADWQQALELLDDKIGFYGNWLKDGTRPDWPNAATPKPMRSRRTGA
jgi:DNA-binding transcriptional MerR regulator